MEQVIHPYVKIKSDKAAFLQKAEERLRAMNNVMTETNCSEEQALKILHYTQEEIEEYKALVGRNKKIS